VIARSGVVPALVVVALLAVGAVATGTTAPVPVAVARGARLAAAGTGTTWYCAEGTANPGGRANEEVEIGNVDRRPMQATLTVDGGAEAPPVVRGYTVAPGRVVRVPVSTIAPVTDPGVVVETRGGRGVVEHAISRGGDVALGPCAREPRSHARFAAGTTSKGSELWLALFNPFPDDAIVDVEAVTDTGRRAPGQLQGIVVPRLTRLSVAIHAAVQRVDTVATQVSVRRGRVIAEQSQFLDGTDGRTGIALSETSGLARRWLLPNAEAGNGWQQRLVLVNPGARDATVHISFALDAAAAVEPITMTVPAASVAVPDLTRVPDGIAYAMDVRASVPITAEGIGASVAPRPANRRGIASDPGITDAARVWAIAPARLASRSADAVVVVSTDARPHALRIVAPGAAGDRIVVSARVPRVGRLVLALAPDEATPDAAFLLVADGPVAVERQSELPGLTRSHAVPG
jgi:hypothetical protein